MLEKIWRISVAALIIYAYVLIASMFVDLRTHNYAGIAGAIALGPALKEYLRGAWRK